LGTPYITRSTQNKASTQVPIEYLYQRNCSPLVRKRLYQRFTPAVQQLKYCKPVNSKLGHAEGHFLCSLGKELCNKNTVHRSWKELRQIW